MGGHMENHAVQLNHMLVELFHQITKIEHRVLAQQEFQDLTLPEIHVLEQIDQEPCPIMSDVAARLGITLSTLTTSVSRLVKKGYVHKRRSTTDKRLALLSLTAKGKRINQLHARFHQEMIEVILQHTNEEEQRILLGSLSHLTSFFMQHYHIT